MSEANNPPSFGFDDPGSIGDLLRTVHLRPYRKGAGPTFTLRVWDTIGYGLGRARLAYALTMREGGKRTVVFLGSDFSPSPTDAIDSDDAVASLLCFLTLRPGDTDSDYFASYTPDQITFTERHAEALSIAAFDRFGER